MTFDDLVQNGINVGFKLDPNKNYHKLILKNKDAIVFELSFPNDSIESKLNNSTKNISWDYKIIDGANEKIIYKDWLEYYDETAEENLKCMKEDILDLITNITTRKFKIIEKSVFAIFGKKFLKYKELIFE